MANEQRKKKDYLVPLLIVAGLLFVWFLILIGSPEQSIHTPTQQQEREPTAIELHVQAQQFVKQALKSPSTAKFPLEPVSVGTDGNGLYQVESYVDSQNSFGAMIRSEWILNMRDAGDTWKLEKMRIDGTVVYDALNDNTK